MGDDSEDVGFFRGVVIAFLIVVVVCAVVASVYFTFGGELWL